MNFKIHRGTKEIGGSCVEIWTDSARVVLDLGMPLVNKDKSRFDERRTRNKTAAELIHSKILPNISELYSPGGSAALILSHAHLDHYGLAGFIHPDTPVYMGASTHRLIEITNIFTNRSLSISNPVYFKSGESFSCGDIQITPYLMDHSAFDAHAFLIEADKKTLFYSGDFRAHGRKIKAFDWFSRNVKKDIDYLLLEGTSISRCEENFLTEEDIEHQFAESFRQARGIALIYASGQNIDRIVSIYKACKRTGRTLAIDFYIANVLKEMASFGAKIPFPDANFPEIKVFFPHRLSSRTIDKNLLYRFKTFKITRQEIDAQFEKIAMIVRPGISDFFSKLNHIDGGLLIYSLWSGYQKEEKTKEFLDSLLARGMTLKELHTSGHADRKALKEMVETLKPKNIVPIHTFESSQYSEIFTGSNVLVLEDREQVRV